jgi:acetyl-CoA synthetase
MNPIIKKYLPKTEFSSYDDFMENYSVNVPPDFNFGYDIVDEWAHLEPQKPALLWCDDRFETKHYTFADVKELSNKAANAFVKLGIKKGDVVMLILKQRPEVWWSMIALCKIGAICIPATYQLTTKDIVYRCNSAGIKMIVTVDDSELLANIQRAQDKCASLQTVAVVGDTLTQKIKNLPEGYVNFQEEIAQAAPDFERVENKSEDPTLIYFSSGTSGMPKMVLHDHTLALGHIVTALFWQRVQNNTIHWTQTDSGWAKFAWGKIYGQWICGATVGAYDTEKFVPEMMLKAIEIIRPTTFCAPATIYRYLIKEDLSGTDFSFIQHASVAGEPLNPEVYHQIKQKTGLTIHEGFGQSEGSVLLANFGWDEIKPGSMGKPAPLYDIKLLDDYDRECEKGDIGVISVTGINKKHPTGLFKKYYLDEETTAACWNAEKGIYKTGDMAWCDADGYFWFVGRSDDVIKCSGYRIGPFEVENALLEHPSVLECAVTAAEDPLRGQVVKATIVLVKTFTASEELKKELQNHVKKVTAPYKYPRIVEFVDELPKTVSGKIRRNEIRKQDAKV